jgi:SAM-dependent methyltransferase
VKPALLDLLVDPVQHQRLHLDEGDIHGDSIQSGMLRAADGSTYPIRSGIPRIVLTDNPGQVQTSESFGFKWQNSDISGSPAVRADLIPWMVEKYGFASQDDWSRYCASRCHILDVGCGSGVPSSYFLETRAWTGEAMWVGVDISAAIDVAQERLGHITNTHFVQADALQLPFPDRSFDTIFSEGVLHHTPSTRRALLAVTRLLQPGGEFHFYVYRRKSPLREFTDDHIRAAIASLSDEEAWDAMRSLTRLGEALSELEATIVLEDGVPLLGIPPGEHNVQRLIYWNFAKLYWNPNWSFEENVHVNFDWYRPRYSHRQTADEVREWCAEAALSITRFHEQESGFTVRATKV